MKEAEERARENLASTSWLVVVLCRSCAVINKSRCLWVGAGIDNSIILVSSPDPTLAGRRAWGGHETMVQAGCDLFMELR